MTTFLTPKEVADRLRIKTTTLQAMRSRGGGPAFIKVGHRNVLYNLADVEAWEAKRKFNNTAEEKADQTK